MNPKMRHVVNAPQTCSHTCHWPGCKRQVPPAMWGCRPHWFALPGHLRAHIWQTYQVGQEERGDPSRDYLNAAIAVQRWIRENQRGAK